MDEKDLLALCHGLIDRARSAGADQAEAVATWEGHRETRLENGEVHSVESSDETIFGLRVLVADALGFITANQTDAATLDACAAEVVAQAKATPADAYNGLPDPEPIVPVAGLHDDRLTAMTVEDTTRLATMMVERVRSGDERVRIDSGSVSASTAVSAIASTAGMALSERATAAEGYLFGMAVEGEEVASFDYDGEGTRKATELSHLLAEAADGFVAKCVAGLRAGRGRSFKGAVVLSPEAVAEFLLPNLLASISADAVRKGRSAMAGKVGTAIASTALTLIDDGTLPAGMASSAFDREGVPTQRRVLLDAGVLGSYLFNHYEAVAAGNGQRSTGHATGAASTLPGIGASALEIAAGSSDEDDMLAGDGPAVYVRRFSGSTNPVTGDFSGVVKNGFLVESGSRRPIREVLIAGNLFEMLQGITAISAERRLVGSVALLPALRIEGVSVTAG
jgi:PmbA protein